GRGAGVAVGAEQRPGGREDLPAALGRAGPRAAVVGGFPPARRGRAGSVGGTDHTGRTGRGGKGSFLARGLGVLGGDSGWDNLPAARGRTRGAGGPHAPSGARQPE